MQNADTACQRAVSDGSYYAVHGLADTTTTPGNSDQRQTDCSDRKLRNFGRWFCQEECHRGNFRRPNSIAVCRFMRRLTDTVAGRICFDGVGAHKRSGALHYWSPTPSFFHFSISKRTPRFVDPDHDRLGISGPLPTAPGTSSERITRAR